MYEHTKSGWGCLFGASGLLSATVAVLLACVLTLGAAAPVCATERCELIRLYFKANELRGKIEAKENAMHAHARDARDLKRWLDERRGGESFPPHGENPSVAELLSDRTTAVEREVNALRRAAAMARFEAETLRREWEGVERRIGVLRLRHPDLVETYERDAEEL